MANETFTLGASHLADAGWEIQRTNNFEISIAGVGETDRLLTLSVISGSLPSEHNQVLTIQQGNASVKVAGVYTIDAGSLAVRDFIQKDTEAMIERWRSQVYNKATDGVGFAANYKKEARVVQYAPDGTIARAWKISGVWVSDVNYGNMDNSNNNLKQIDLTLQYDKARRIDKDTNQLI